MKVVIYSACYGGYDPNPYDIRAMIKDNVTFRFFTDSLEPNGPGVPATYNGWQVLRTIEEPFDGKDKYAKMNRYWKINQQVAAPDSDINIYIDSNKKLFNIDMLLGYCQELYDNPDLDAIFCRHTERDTVQQEVREICRLRRDEPAKVMRQYKEYRDEGFPDNIPLIVASVQIRKTHALALQSMLDCWWREVRSKSYRDQISMPYAIWKTGFTRYRTINVWTERLKMIANLEHRKVLSL